MIFKACPQRLHSHQDLRGQCSLRRGLVPLFQCWSHSGSFPPGSVVLAERKSTVTEHITSSHVISIRPVGRCCHLSPCPLHTLPLHGSKICRVSSVAAWDVGVQEPGCGDSRFLHLPLPCRGDEVCAHQIPPAYRLRECVLSLSKVQLAGL